MKVIVRADGGVSLFPSTGDVAGDKDIFERWKESARREWLPATLEETSQPIPDLKWHGSNMSDRTKSDGTVIKKDGAFKWAGNKVVIDMPDARIIKMTSIRKDRNKRLEDTDRELVMLDGGVVPAALAKTQDTKRYPAECES